MLILGLLVTLGLTFSEVLRGAHKNFMIFQWSTLDFWNGANPYAPEWFSHGLDFFLYPPAFNIFFTPFAYLPSWLGPFVWNVFNFSLYALAIYTLPRITVEHKAKILLYSLPILATTLLSFQYNVAIAYIYLFSFTLLEKGKGKWAVLLIMISALTKVYGIFELAILLFYPKFWKNIGWAAIWGIIIFCLPALRLGGNLLPYYGDWIHALGAHEDSRIFETFFDIRLLFPNGHPTLTPLIQMGSMAVIAVIVFCRRQLWHDFGFRAGTLAIIMGWIMLFGNATEKHTYVIAIVGYLFWYWTLQRHTVFDKVLYWTNLVVLVLMPVDIICPPVVMRFFFDTLDFNQWLFLVTWLTIIIKTYRLWPARTL